MYTVKTRTGADTEGIGPYGAPVARYHPEKMPHVPKHIVVHRKDLAIQHIVLPMEFQSVGVLEVRPVKYLVERSEGGLEGFGGDGLVCNQGNKTEQLAGNWEDGKRDPRRELADPEAMALLRK